MNEPDEVLLELTGACIETTARRVYRALSATLMTEDGPNPRAERALDLLAAFLQQTDFGRLRTDHPELSGTERVRVRLQRERGGRVGWRRAD